MPKTMMARSGANRNKITEAAEGIARILAELVADASEPGPASRWMRASESPLGREVRRLVARGEIVGARPGKYLLVDRESHDAWIAAHAVRPKAAPIESEDDLAATFGVVRRVG